MGQGTRAARATGAEVLGKIGREASAVAQRFKGRHRQPRQVSINLTLPDGVRVIGTVPDVYNDTIVRSTFSRAKARDDVRLWTEVLALAAAQPGPAVVRLHGQPQRRHAAQSTCST